MLRYVRERLKAVILVGRFIDSFSFLALKL